MGGQGAKAGSIAYDESISPTLCATASGSNQVPDIVQSAGFSDSLGERAKGGMEFIEGRAPTLRAGDVRSIVYCLQGNGIDRADTAGCNGRGWREGGAYTLNTIDRPAVVYDARGNGSGGVAPTLTGDHENRVTDYTAIAVYDTTQITSPLNYSNPKPGDACHPLASQQHPPLVVCAGNGQLNNISMEQQSNTLDCMHDQQIVLKESDRPPRRYIVRRLTPLECCRLQGYPDGWTENLETAEPTEEEIAFFIEVWARWADINGTKPKSRAQVIKWLKDPGSDSAEYKAYGNSLAIPCSSDVLGRIAAFEEENENGYQTD